MTEKILIVLFVTALLFLLPYYLYIVSMKIQMGKVQALKNLLDKKDKEETK